MTTPRRFAGAFDRIGTALFCVTAGFLLWMVRAYVPNREFLPESEPAFFAILIASAIAALGLALVFMWLPRLMTPAIYASSALFLFFVAGHLRASSGGDWPAYLLLMWIAGVAVLLTIVRQEVPARHVHTFAGITGYLFAASVVVSAGSVPRRTPPAPRPQPAGGATPAVQVDSQNTSDVYILMFDGLGLRAEDRPVDVTASDDLRVLMDRGFSIYDRAYANYPITYMSMASMTASRHLGDGWSWVRELDTIRYTNPLFAGAMELGYDVTLYSGYGWASLCDPIRTAWNCVSPATHEHEPDPFLYEPERARQARKLVTLTLMQLPRGDRLASALGIGDIDGGLRAFQTVHGDVRGRLASNGRADFVFAHVIFPHGASAVNADCSGRGWQAAFARPEFRDLVGYRRASDCAFRLMRQFTDTLERAGALERSLVIFMADHGSAFGGQFYKPLDLWNEREIHERFSAFFAMKPPGQAAGGVVSRPMQLLDLTPTLLTMLGGRPGPGMEGRDFREYAPSAIEVFLAGYENLPSFNKARFLKREITFPDP